ncbi:MAG: hypothetical protein NVS3B20_06990 [Polyangiales bacterium]
MLSEGMYLGMDRVDVYVKGDHDRAWNGPHATADIGGYGAKILDRDTYRFRILPIAHKSSPEKAKQVLETCEAIPLTFKVDTLNEVQAYRVHLRGVHAWQEDCRQRVIAKYCTNHEAGALATCTAQWRQ